MIPTIDRLPTGFPDKPDDRSAHDRSVMLGRVLCFILTVLFLAGAIWLKGCVMPQVAGAAEINLAVIARTQIGYGEVGANNKGPYVRKYLNGQEGVPWCAGFVSWCVKEAGIKQPYTLRAKNFCKYGKKIRDYEIREGDIVVFNRNGGGHVGIICEVGEWYFACIEGNVGKYPAKVKYVIHKNGERNINSFIRLTAK